MYNRNHFTEKCSYNPAYEKNATTFNEMLPPTVYLRCNAALRLGCWLHTQLLRDTRNHVCSRHAHLSFIFPAITTTMRPILTLDARFLNLHVI